MPRILLAAPMVVAAALLAGCSQPQEQATTTNATAPAADTAQGPGGPGGFGEDQTVEQMVERTMMRFARLDADGDGKLTQAELAPPPEPEGGVDENAQGRRRGFGGRGMARADANDDGVVTRAEVEAQTRTRFTRLDADADGTVTRDELVASFDGRGRGGEGGPPQ